MNNGFVLRQVALVSYGTRYLRHELALEDFYRHGIFFDARLQFRDGANHTLKADDFTVWLGALRKLGARRLSLHPVSQLQDAMPTQGDHTPYVIVVHFDARYQLWACGWEQPEWQEDPGSVSASPYSADLDSYWHVNELPGTLDVPRTDWKALALAIRADVGTLPPSRQDGARKLIAEMPSDQAWASLQIFPWSDAMASAHHLAAALTDDIAHMDNALNPKNEANFMAQEQYGERYGRVQAWLDEVLFRSANEDPGNRSGATAALHYRTMPPVDAAPPPGPAAPMPPLASVPVPSQSRPWHSKAGWLLALLVISAMVAALAHFIARWPWLALLVGLPIMLRGRSKPGP